MRKTFKYRLYPTSAQRTALEKQLDCCRWVYNKALETRRDTWQNEGKGLSCYDTVKMLPEWKEAEPWLKQGHAQAMQEALQRLDLAFQAFFRRVKNGENPGYPRFRGHDRYDSFTYPQEKGNWRFLDNGRVRLSKIGHVKIKLHRPIVGTAKTLTIRRDSLGNWYACFSCEFTPEPLPPVPAVVGVDMGLESFATLSTGEKIENPRFFRHDEKALAKAQRRLSKAEKGTPEYRKHKRVVQHVHERVANRRRDFAHKLSRQLVNGYQFIAFENLDIQEMQAKGWHGLNKSIGDAAWNQLIQYTTHKAEWAGRRVVTVDPRNTSKMCSGCGALVDKDLSVRVHSCPHCGLELDRDHNAALNILGRGLASVGSIPRSSPL
jgi:putative transposase